MRTVEEALEIILGQVRRLPAERTPLLETPGRILAEEIAADIDVPPFDNSEVDGYAVRAADTAGASADAPVVLRSLADIPAGAVGAVVVTPGTAARIMTGAPIPPGADAVVMVEATQATQDHSVATLTAMAAGEHIRRAGEDIARGTVVLSEGATIRSGTIALLATMGRTSIATVRRPRVAVISTGDEVTEPEEGVIPPLGKIRNSNLATLAALVREAGAEVHSMTHIPDDPEATEATLRAFGDPLHGVDVIITAGGVSVGDRDFVKPAVERLGRLDLWRVAVKPGKPLAFGAIGETLFFGLPGNPASALVTFELFVRPTLRKMAGHAEHDLHRIQLRARLEAPIRHTPGRREFVRAVTTAEAGRLVTRPAGAQGSASLASMAAANSLCVVPDESGDLAAGCEVAVLLLDRG